MAKQATKEARETQKAPSAPDDRRLSIRAPLLTWPRHPTARQYWVRITLMTPSGEQELLAYVTREPKFRVPTTWHDAAGRRQSLVIGRYGWSVWPVTRDRFPSGAPFARGAFTVK